jgi:hypothetical protein
MLFLSIFQFLTSFLKEYWFIVFLFQSFMIFLLIKDNRTYKKSAEALQDIQHN